MTRTNLLKDNKNKPKYKLEVTIESANNGWFLKENHFNNEIFCVTLDELIIQARKIFLLFQNDILQLEKYDEVSLIDKLGKIEKKLKKPMEKQMPVDEEENSDEEEEEEEMPVKKQILTEVTDRKWLK